MCRLFVFAVAAMVIVSASWAQAGFSTSIIKPTPVGANGVISDAFPAAETTYYFTVDAQPGTLLTQISYQGREGADQALEFALLNESGKKGEWYWIHGSGAVEEATRSFPIDKKGRQVVSLTVKGPETGGFRVELGGSALNGTVTNAQQVHNGLSRSIFTPTPVAETGVIAGALPGTNTKATYYFVIRPKAGDLLTQISYKGRKGARKELTLQLLDTDARGADWYWIHGSDPQEESTRSFPIDNSGEKLLRVTVQGPESDRFCVLLGGTALPTNGDQDCWPAAQSGAGKRQTENTATTDLRAAKIDVVESKCEQRLRIGADVLFDFDKSETRREAAPTLDAAAKHLRASQHAARVEGHTDGKGADAYNQPLSEKRAASVRNYLVQHGVASDRITSMGFGKTRPISANTNSDGSDNPEGRQQNRRVELVIDTCAQTASVGR
ncbi:MAG: OmpA family protein [Deltaproteobacteria bacterium]|nr:OmpA family protein [Deltaproteobacteria bacterium]